MMVQLGTDGPAFSEQFVAAAAFRARYVADLIGRALQQLGIDSGTESRPVRFPADFLRDLGAVLQLKVWEGSGITAHLDAGLPSADEASSQVASRAMSGGYDETTDSTSTLSHRVFRLTMEEFGWDGPGILGADVHLRNDDDDAFVDMLAEFLWQNRHAFNTTN